MRVAVAMACFVLCVSPALAQSQGRVVDDGAIIWRTDVSIAAASARAGMVLEIVARYDRWYEVVIPDSLGGRGERGRIAVTQVELLPGSPQPPVRQVRGGPVTQAPRTPGGTARAPSSSGRRLGGYISANGGYQVTSNDFGDGATFRENAEDGRFDTSYTVKGGPTLDVAGGVTVSQVAIGVGVTRFSRSTPVRLTGTVPHPFFFSRPRSVSGDIGGMKREELAVHIQVRGVAPLGNRLQLAVFGGPSFFQLKQDIVTDFLYADDYPYDSASFERAENTNQKESKFGFNAGGDVAFFFTRQLGVGFSAQFSRAEVTLPSAGTGTQDVKVGGTQAGVGLRLRF